MKTIKIFLTVSMILLGGFSELWAGQVLGYPIAEKQAKFYMMILITMGVPVAMVGAVYLVLWIAERKKAEKPKILAAEATRGNWRLCSEDFNLSI